MTTAEHSEILHEAVLHGQHTAEHVTSTDIHEGRCWSTKIFHFLLSRETLLD